MKKQTWILITFLSLATTFTFSQERPTQMNPDKVSIKRTVELPLNVSNHIPVIEAKINGKGPYKFALDTGFGGMVEVSTKLAADLAISIIGEARTGDPSGRNPTTVRLLHIDSMDIGSARFEGLTINESGRRGPVEADGIIGLNLFNGLLVKLDYIHDKFNISSGSLPSKELTYTNEHGVPSIEIDVSGKKTNVDIDSGGPAEVSLPLDMAKSLPLTAEPRVIGRGRTADGDFEVYGSTLKGEVRVGEIVLKDPRVDFVSIFPNGNLGYGFLKNLTVTFDPANRRVKFEK